MEKIDEQLNNLSEVEIPMDMHQSVMRKINHHKIQLVLFVAFTLLVFNFLVLAWHIDTKLVNADFASMVRDFLDVFNFNLAFVTTMLGSFFDIISPTLVLSAFLSLGGALYFGNKISSSNFIGNKKYFSY